MARRIYRPKLNLFDALYVAHGRDVRRAMGALEPVLDGVTGDSAYVVLERVLSASQD